MKKTKEQIREEKSIKRTAKLLNIPEEEVKKKSLHKKLVEAMNKLLNKNT